MKQLIFFVVVINQFLELLSFLSMLDSYRKIDPIVHNSAAEEIFPYIEPCFGFFKNYWISNGLVLQDVDSPSGFLMVLMYLWEPSSEVHVTETLHNLESLNRVSPLSSVNQSW